MADPPWDIHMELPYGTLTDSEMIDLNLGRLCLDNGLLNIHTLTTVNTFLLRLSPAKLEESEQSWIGPNCSWCKVGRTGAVRVATISSPIFEMKPSSPMIISSFCFVMNYKTINHYIIL